jgi:hypothetical protein
MNGDRVRRIYVMTVRRLVLDGLPYHFGEAGFRLTLLKVIQKAGKSLKGRFF